jgi:hypothetical protein
MKRDKANRVSPLQSQPGLADLLSLHRPNYLRKVLTAPVHTRPLFCNQRHDPSMAWLEVAPATAKMRLVQLADEIISVLSSDPNAVVKVTVDIAAEFPDGATDQVKRAVSENARTLGLKNNDWE